MPTPLETVCPYCQRVFYYLPEEGDRLVHCMYPDCRREIAGLVGQEVPSGIEPVGTEPQSR